MICPSYLVWEMCAYQLLLPGSQQGVLLVLGKYRLHGAVIVVQ